MQYYNWYNQCPYASYYGYSYPASSRKFDNYAGYLNDIYDFADEGAWQDIDMDQPEQSRAQRDVERVIPLVFQSSANEINQAVMLGMRPDLVAYMVREMVEYIDRNYETYDKSASYNITQAAESIKTRYYWIANIFRIYGVPFEVYTNLLNNVVITSLRNLRLPARNQDK